MGRRQEGARRAPVRDVLDGIRVGVGLECRGIEIILGAKLGKLLLGFGDHDLP